MAGTMSVKDEYELNRIFAELPTVQKLAVSMLFNHHIDPETIKQKTGIDEEEIYQIMINVFFRWMAVIMPNKENVPCNN